MSRVGKYPVIIPSGVKIQLSGNCVAAEGSLGKMLFNFASHLVSVVLSNESIVVQPKNSSKVARQMWGTARARIANLVLGVSIGFKKVLVIHGIGYKASISGSKLVLSLGLSHDVLYDIPADVTMKISQSGSGGKSSQLTCIEIFGMDKQIVGQVAAEIRAFRPPEPYKGKGIRCLGEHVILKEGKKK